MRNVERDFSGTNVLIVEDDSVTALLSSEICKALGCRVVVVNNGVEAVDAFEHDDFDVVLMDLQMPLMGGYEATFEMRSLERQMGKMPTPIVAVSGTVEKDTYVRCMSAGLDDCVVKPYRMNMVRDILTKYGARFRPADHTGKPSADVNAMAQAI